MPSETDTLKLTQTKAEASQLIYKLSKKCLLFYALIFCDYFLCSITEQYFTDRLSGQETDPEKVKDAVVSITFLRI